MPVCPCQRIALRGHDGGLLIGADDRDQRVVDFAKGVERALR
jgi:hypothetical protein